MRTSKLLTTLAIVAVVLLLPQFASAAPGDLIQNVPLPVSGVGVSVAVDCLGNVYFTITGDAMLHKMDKDGVLLASLPIMDAAGNNLEMDEMSFQNSGGSGILWAQLHGSNPIDVYRIDPATGVATLAFTSITISGGSYRDGIAFDGSNNTLWISADVSTTIEHYALDGTFLGQITPTDAAGNELGAISGITVGAGDLMYLGRNGFAQIVQVKKSDGSFISVFASPGGARDEGLECDPINFAPRLALWSREFNPPGFMSVIELEPGTCACGGGPGGPTEVAVDIKPTSCPNPFELKPDGTPASDGHFNPLVAVPAGPASDKSVLPVAILGSEDLDVADIDPETITLNGVSPRRWSIQDVAGPVGNDAEECECTTAGPDGYMDLTLKFNRAALAATFGPVSDGDYLELTLAGNLMDGTAIEGSDCILIRLKGGNGLSGAEETPFALESYPNPFNAAASIRYTLSEPGDVHVSIYNILGQHVATLADGFQSAGQYTVTWDARDAASGMYFYRLQVNGNVVTRQMTLLK